MNRRLASSVLHGHTRDGHPWEIIREHAVGKTDQKPTNLLSDLDAPGTQVRAQGKFLCIAVQSGNDEWFGIVCNTLESPIE